MKQILNLALFILLLNSSNVIAQHSIFTDDNRTIQCKIERLNKDSIFFRPNYDSLHVEFLLMENVLHYSYNIISNIDLYETESPKEPTKMEILNYNKWELITSAGRNIKGGIGMIGLGTAVMAIAPLTFNVDNGKVDYSLPVILYGTGLILDIIGISNLLKAGDDLEKAGKKGNSETSFKMGITGFSICKRF